jgi:hypothetical protein
MPTSEEDVGSGQKSEDELNHELLVSNTPVNVAPQADSPESQVADSRDDGVLTTHNG